MDAEISIARRIVKGSSSGWSSIYEVIVKEEMVRNDDKTLRFFLERRFVQV